MSTSKCYFKEQYTALPIALVCVFVVVVDVWPLYTTHLQTHTQEKWLAPSKSQVTTTEMPEVCPFTRENNDILAYTFHASSWKAEAS